MTTISTSANTLASLMALYNKTDQSATGDSGASGTGLTTGLTTAQVGSLTSLVNGDAGDTSSSGGLSSLLSGSVDTGAILDAIEAKTQAAANAAGSDGSDGATTTGTSTATTEQQKAATLMQSVYETQQSNLFTLLA